MPRRNLWQDAALKEQLSRQAVRRISFDHIERLVDRAADDRVKELERILPPEEVKPNEDGRSRTKLACFHAGKRGRVAQLGPVAEDRGRTEERKRLRLKASEAKPDGARNALCADFQQTGHLLGVRARFLPGNRVQHRTDEERISAGRRHEGVAEGFVRLQTMQLARESLDRGSPERSRTNRDDLRSGDQLRDKRGIAALALRRTRPRDDQQRHPLQSAHQVDEPAHGRDIRPVQIVDR
jgi:hypothetical protein